MTQCGIYEIRNKNTGKVYVGKTTNSCERFIRHRYLLRNNKHYNEYLQRSFNKHGEQAFEFKLVEECASETLPDCEQKWIDQHGSDNLYNLTMDVADLRNDRNPFFGKKHTVETKQKMSLAKKGCYLGESNPNWGGKNKEKLRSLMLGSKNKNAKLNEEQILEIKQMLAAGKKHQEIADIYGVSRSVITRINSGTRWSHIKENVL